MDTEQNAQQIQQLLASSSRICIMPGYDHPLDTLPASLGLAQTLRALNKHVSIRYARPAPSILHFLPLHAYMEDPPFFDGAVVVGSSEEGEEQDISCPVAVIGTEQYTGERGSAFLIDEGASSCAELVAKLIKIAWEEDMPQESATSLLAGIIAHTDNFRREQTRPQTLFAAAYLIGKQADRSAIIQALYKERSLEFIRLWGKALLHIDYYEERGVAWSHLAAEDFADTGAETEVVPGIVRELVASVPQANYTIMLWQDRATPPDLWQTIIHAQDEGGAQEVARLLGGTRRKNNLITSLRGREAQDAVSMLVRMLP